MIDSDDNMYLTVDSSIEINKITTGLNITFRKINVTPYRFYKMYMDKDLIKDQLY